VAVGFAEVGVGCGAVLVGDVAGVGDVRVPVVEAGLFDGPGASAAGVSMGAVAVGTVSAEVVDVVASEVVVEVAICDSITDGVEVEVGVIVTSGAACRPPQATSVNVNNRIAISA